MSLCGTVVCGECECESVSFCENDDENDGILFKTGENEEVVQTLGENLVKMRCFLVVGLWAGTARGKWPCPTGGTAQSDGPRLVLLAG